MVQICAETIVLQQALTQRLKKAVFHLGSRAATLANQMVVRMARQFKFEFPATEVSYKHETKFVEKLQRPVNSRLVRGGITLLHGREYCVDGEMVPLLGQNLHDHKPALSELVAFLP